MAGRFGVLQSFGIKLNLGACLLVAASCSDPPPPSSEPGYSYQLKDDTCAGVTATVVCEESYCQDSAVACNGSYYVSAKASSGGDGSQGKPFQDLPEAAKKAAPGDCVLVGPGTYHGALFPGGVSILGAGAKVVTIVEAKKGDPVLAISGGSGSSIRGLGISGGTFGLVLSKTKGVKVSQTRVSGAEGVGLYAQDTTGIILDHVAVIKTKAVAMQKSTEKVGIGVLLNKGATATIRHSLLWSNGQLGLMTSDSSVDMTSSAVVENGVQGVSGAGGIVLHASTSCKTTHTGKLSTVEMHKNLGVGLTVAGPKTELKNVQVTNTRYGGGNMRQISVQATSSFTMADSKVSDCDGQGIVIDGDCVGENPEPIFLKLNNNTVSNNMDRGIWLQNIKAPKSVVLEKNTISGNLLVGIGGTKVAGIKVIGGTISGTQNGPLPKGDTSTYMGDAMQVLSGSSMTITGVTFVKNGRLSVIFDGSSGEVSKSTFSTSVPAVVVQKGSKGKVTHSGNTFDSGKPAGITEPSKSYAIDDKVQPIIGSLPVAPVTLP